MLFNRKLSKCISVVLASSALCSNSLVIAINRTTKIFVPALMFKSKDNIAGYFPDDINNKELLRYVYGVLMDGDKCVGLYIDGKILADDKIIPIYSKDKKYIGDYVNFEIWFREMICQILASLDRERLLKVCKLISFEGESGHLEFVTFGVVELVGFPKPEYLVSDTDVCAEDFISDISIFFDEFKKYLKNDKSNINFWGIMANFFKDFLVDLSNQSFDFDNKKFKYFDKIYYFHYFILVINMLKLSGIKIRNKIDSYLKYLKDINRTNFCEKIKLFLYDNMENYNSLAGNSFDLFKDIVIPCLRQCLEKFCAFIKSLVDSGQLEKLLKE